MLTEQQQAELLSGFGPWVAAQNPSDHYPYLDGEHCAFATYLKYMGYYNISVSGHYYNISGVRYQFPRSYAFAISSGEDNYGELTKRLRAAGWLNGDDASQPVHLSPDTLTAGML